MPRPHVDCSPPTRPPHGWASCTEKWEQSHKAVVIKSSTCWQTDTAMEMPISIHFPQPSNSPPSIAMLCSCSVYTVNLCQPQHLTCWSSSEGLHWMLAFGKNLTPCALWSGGWLYVLCFLIAYLTKQTQPFSFPWAPSRILLSLQCTNSLSAFQSWAWHLRQFDDLKCHKPLQYAPNVGMASCPWHYIHHYWCHLRHVDEMPALFFGTQQG